MPAKKSAARRVPKDDGVEEPRSAPANKTIHDAGNATSDEIGRAQILRKYWELANLDPEVTKGAITGQLKALDSLCEALALTQAGRESEKPAAQQIYRSAWMRSAGKKKDEE